MSESILTDAEMQEIGEEFGPLRPDVCRIRRRRVVTDPATLDTAITWDAPGSPVPCRVSTTERSVREGTVGFRVNEREEMAIALPLTTAVERDDRIDHQESGLTFDVLNSPMAPSFGFERLCMVATTDLPQGSS